MDERLNLLLKTEEKDKLRLISKETGLTMSEIIRSLINNDLVIQYEPEAIPKALKLYTLCKEIILDETIFTD